MKRIQIKSINDSNFQAAWDLYLNSFPIDERRAIEVQEILMKHNDYHFEIVNIADEFIGFIAWWQFDQLRFIEHFATLNLLRGKGYGKMILLDLLLESNELTILEVEYPIVEMNQRRIVFYERLGFKMNNYKYQQLPLRKGGAKVDLLVMSYPRTIDETTLSKFEDDFKKKCFEFYFE